MRYDDDEEREDLAPARRPRRPRRGWSGTAGQRGRAARGLPPAVFKITSYSHSAGAVWSRFAYISRDGELEAEGPDGERYELEELEQVLAEWEGEGKRRLAMSALVTFPRGTDEARATEAARAFFAEAFADNHDYVLAGHRDTANFHVHIVVQARGHDGKQIRIGRDDIQDLRLLFAEKAAEQGIELDASPRWARGEEKARGAGAEIEGMLRRWRQPELELAGAVLPSPTRREQLEALIEVRRDRDPAAAVSPLEYARAAEHVMAHAGALEEHAEQVRAMKSAVQLARFGLQQSQAPDCPAAEGAAVEQVVGMVDKDVGRAIRELGPEPDVQREAREARRPLAEQLAAHRPPPERRWSREAARPGPWEACQALEYAKTAGQAAVQLGELTNDRDRVAAVEGAVQLARFAWELASKDQGRPEERAHAREIIDKTERSLRFSIKEIEDPQAQKQAIQARQRLYKAGVQEYRQARQAEREQERKREREKDTGPEREL